MTATLPAALLVALWWRDGRLSIRRHVLAAHSLVRPRAALLGLFTAWVEKNVIGAEGASFDLSFWQRGLVAGRAIWFYLSKLLGRQT